MKTTLSFGLFLSCALTASAQGTLEFTAFLHGTNVVPPSLTPVTGQGRFFLDGNTFSFEVRTYPTTGWTGAVYGAAAPGFNAPALFSLGYARCRAPFPPDPGECLYQGSVVLSNDQITDLLAGLWYVQTTSSRFPELAMRGQIVPEPCAVSLLGGFLVSLLGVRFIRRRCSTGNLPLVARHSSCCFVFGQTIPIANAPIEFESLNQQPSNTLP